MAALVLVAAALLGVAAAKPAHPHIIHILADDLGWAELGYHRPGDNTGDVKTPNIDALVKNEALELDRHYAHKICSPSRCSIQTGRAPIHVNVQNVLPDAHNAADPVGGYQGIPINMTGIAEHLRGAGYKTHLVGKWDAGMATPLHSPFARGYDSWLGYWHHSNAYWSQTEGKCGLTSIFDLWRANASSHLGGPARDLQNGASCSQGNQAPAGEKCVYEEALLTGEVKRVISEHDPSQPLFLFWSMHLVHMPLEVPQQFLDAFAFIDDPFRQKMHAMTNYMDHEVGEVVALLKSTGLWQDALVVFHADNGGEILAAGICGGNNWPLRGGKFSNWEGGIRVSAFVAGGVLPPARRGQKERGLGAVWDWYATYAGLAGVDPTDAKAQKAGLPPPDSLDLWPMLARGAASPREEILIGDTSAMLPNGDGKTLVGGVIQHDLKLLLGTAETLYTIDQDVTTGPSWPNSTSHLTPLTHFRTCGRSAAKACLFNLTSDPYEEHNLAEAMPDVFARMLARIDAAQKSVYSPVRGGTDKSACKQAKGANGDYWGPWLNL